jgi:hypothetical protein
MVRGAYIIGVRYSVGRRLARNAVSEHERYIQSLQHNTRTIYCSYCRYIYMCVRSTSVQSGDEDNGVVGLQFVLDAVHQLPVRVRG